MKTVLASAGLMAATASAVTTIGNGVPVTYAAEPYTATTYNGTRYNGTVISGVALNSSNEWPCFDTEDYESIIPACSVSCINIALRGDGCDVGDFWCHCQTLHSNKLDSIVVPCLTTGDTATCSGEEIGALVNFIHGSLCPYMEAKTHAEVYDNCPSSNSSSSSTATTFTSKASIATATVSGTPTTSIWTTVDNSWSRVCEGPTTFAVGGKTWSVDSATILVVTDWPMTVTSTSSWIAAAVATGASYQNSSAVVTTGKAASTQSAGSSPSNIVTGAGNSVRVGAGVAAAVVGVVAMML